MTPIETIQHLYAAFGRGDVATIVDGLADNVRWEHDIFPNPVPWLQPLRGRAQVPGFFETLNRHCDITRFEPKHFFADGLTVVDLIDVEFTVRATGKQVKEPDAVHIWRLNEQGQVLSFRHRVDTYQAVMALRAD